MEPLERLLTKYGVIVIYLILAFAIAFVAVGNPNPLTVYESDSAIAKSLVSLFFAAALIRVIFANISVFNKDIPENAVCALSGKEIRSQPPKTFFRCSKCRKYFLFTEMKKRGRTVYIEPNGRFKKKFYCDECRGRQT